MTIKQFVEKAVEGGYFPPYAHEDWVFGKEGSIGQNRRELAGVLLDPAAWKAVGKVEWEALEVEMPAWEKSEEDRVGYRILKSQCGSSTCTA